MKFVSHDGLLYFWTKVKSYIDNKIINAFVDGGTNDSFLMKDGKLTTTKGDLVLNNGLGRIRCTNDFTQIEKITVPGDDTNRRVISVLDQSYEEDPKKALRYNEVVGGTVKTHHILNTLNMSDYVVPINGSQPMSGNLTISKANTVNVVLNHTEVKRDGTLPVENKYASILATDADAKTLGVFQNTVSTSGNVTSVMAAYTNKTEGTYALLGVRAAIDGSFTPYYFESGSPERKLIHSGNIGDYAVPINGGVPMTGNLQIVKETDEARVSIKNNSHEGRFATSAAGSLGLYDATFSKWIIQSDIEGHVYIDGTRLASFATKQDVYELREDLSILCDKISKRVAALEDKIA